MDDVSRKFASLSIKDLLDAREAYHVHLAHLEGVYATAIGRYLLRDGEAAHAGAKGKTTLGPRRLDNTTIVDASWPCVLVFVEQWLEPDKFVHDRAREYVPSRLYLPDGRVVPTCVVEVSRDPGLPQQPPMPTYKSDLLGGGYPVSVTVQGRQHIGSAGCLVTDGDSVYALTNRHVTGDAGREIFVGFGDTTRRIGVSAPAQLAKMPFGEVYPGWPGQRVLANLDAGLIRIDSVHDWTAQVYGMGEISQVWDLNVDSFSLDMIGCPVAAFGAVSGAMKGRIMGLFYRYKTVGGYEYVSDFAIGPRDAATPVNNLPGNSGTLWFEDVADLKADPSSPGEAPPVNAAGAPRRRAFGLEWGGQELLAPGGRNSVQLALATCLSTICRELDVEVISDWMTGHTEYWGEWGHTKIGALACALIDDAYPALAALMKANGANIGLPDEELEKTWKKATAPDGGPPPLADVADLVWRTTRFKSDESNHFADMDKPGTDGKTLLDMSVDKTGITPEAWNAYYAGIGENDKRGALPFRVWQMYEGMVGFAKENPPNILKFVTAGGLMAHYVGDACQPLHVSQYHHGRDLGDKKQIKVHSVYETTMIGLHGKELLPMIAAADPGAVAPVAGDPPAGQDVAFAVTELMRRTVARLPPLTIVDLFDNNMGKSQTDVLWAQLKDKTAACMKDGALTLARIWEAAWRAGGLTAAPPTPFAYADMEALYRQKCFLPSFPLDKVSLGADGKLVVPPCTETSPGGDGPPPADAKVATAPAKRAKKPTKPKKKAIKAKPKKKVKKAARKRSR